MYIRWKTMSYFSYGPYVFSYFVGDKFDVLSQRKILVSGNPQEFRIADWVYVVPINFYCCVQVVSIFSGCRTGTCNIYSMIYWH